VTGARTRALTAFVAETIPSHELAFPDANDLRGPIPNPNTIRMVADLTAAGMTGLRWARAGPGMMVNTLETICCIAGGGPAARYHADTAARPKREQRTGFDRFASR
jgi:hypothetical protein